jgi:hypothetical protein
VAETRPHADFSSEEGAGILVGPRIAIGVKYLSVEVAKDAVGDMISELLVEVVDVLREDDPRNPGTARGILEMVIVIGEKVLTFVLPKEDRTAMGVSRPISINLADHEFFESL